MTLRTHNLLLWFLLLPLVFGSRPCRSQLAKSQIEDREPVAVGPHDVLPCPVYPESDGPSESNVVRAIVLDGAGNVYFATDRCVFKIDGTGSITRVAGGGRGTPLGQFAAPLLMPRRATETFLSPLALAVDSKGNILVSTAGLPLTVDSKGNSHISGPAIVQIAPSGSMKILIANCLDGSQNGISCINGFAPGGALVGLTVDSSDTLYISNFQNDSGSILKMPQSGQISTFIDSDKLTFGGDGALPGGTYSVRPLGLVMDSQGSLYIADSGNSRIRMVTPKGDITTVAGVGGYGVGRSGYFGDGGPARTAGLLASSGVAVDSADNLYIADMGNARVRKVSSDGTITTVFNFHCSIQDGKYSCPNLAASPVAVDSEENIYVFDSRTEEILKVSPSGQETALARSVTTGKR